VHRYGFLTPEGYRTVRFAVQVAVLAAALDPASLRAASVLNFPLPALGPDRAPGIAVVNPTPYDTTVELTLYAPSGEFDPDRRIRIALRAGEQIVKTVSELLGGGSAEAEGWIQAVSPVDGLAGFAPLFVVSEATFSGSGASIGGSDLTPPARSIVFNPLRFGGDFSTELQIVNPSDQVAAVRMQLASPQGAAGVRIALLPPKGMIRFNPAAWFDGEAPPFLAHFSVQSDVEVAGFAIVRGAQPAVSASRPLEQGSTIRLPYISPAPGSVPELDLVNHSADPVVVTLSAFDSEGMLHDARSLRNNPVARAIAPGSSLRESLADAFGFAADSRLDGWVSVNSTSPIQAALTLSNPESAAFLTLRGGLQGRTRALFPQFATSPGRFTGLALLNPGPLAANVRVVALTPDGEVLGALDTVIRPGERIARLLGTPELIPEAIDRAQGMLWVRSDLPVLASSVFGSAETFADVLPIEPPAPYAPDAHLAPLRMEPPLALLQPGAAQQFRVDGAQGPATWRVNGIAGGNAEVGTIDASGVYTAPASAAGRMVVTIMAEVGSRSVGASVDLLEKGALLGGLSTVQSVAFLQSLGKLYAAEVFGFAGAAQSLATAAGTTRILEVSPDGSRLAVAVFPGEIVAKIVSFPASDGREYLLLASQTLGRILRLDPATRQVQEVVRGLVEPSALVIDPSTGDVLVVERGSITTVPRTLLEAGLAARAAVQPARRSAASR
jgi:hypothetical protein